MSALPVSLAVASPPEATPARAKTAPDFSPDALVRGLLAGDEQAAVALFDLYRALVERTMFGVLGPDPDLSDAVQDAFMSALRTLPKLRDPQALPQWMRRVAVHTAVDRLRRRQRRRWLAVVDPEELADSPDPSANGPEQEALEATYEVLRQMPVEQRTVFTLRYIEGLELLEIASACEFSLATVKRRLSDATRRFMLMAKTDPALSRFVSAKPKEQT